MCFFPIPAIKNKLYIVMLKFDKHVRRYDCLFVLIKRMQKRLQKENAMLWQIDFEKHLCCKYCIICRPNISMSEHEVTSPDEQIYSYSWIDIIHKFIYLHRFFKISCTIQSIVNKIFLALSDANKTMLN